MRALIQDRFGEAGEVLHIVNKELPEPAAGQVRIKIVLSPIHNHDIWTVRGTYGFVPPLPAPAGTEALGIIDVCGPGVEGFHEGQRVVSGTTFGIWAEYAVVDATSLIPVPDQLPDNSAAQLVSMPFSAISLLDFLDLHQGDWLIQNSANGAVGRLLAQLAKARGINVVGLVRRNEAIQELAEQGVSNVVSTLSPNWRDEVRAIVGDAPIAVALDSVGGESTKDLISTLSHGATLISFGSMGSPVMEVPAGAVIFNDLTVRGFWGSKVSKEMTSAKKAELFGELITRALDGTITLPVAATFDAADIAKAVEANATPGLSGKVLLSF